MSKILWKTLLVSPAVLGVSLAISSSALAGTASTTAEVQQPKVQANTSAAQLLASLQKATPTSLSAADIESQQRKIVNTGTLNQQLVAQVPLSPSTPAAASESPSVDRLDEVNRYSSEGQGNRNTVAQVTSVSQLSDVQPTDWAFQALQSLVERYGVIAGYPDGTFRGNRAMTRYEFAAGLNAALDRVNELIAAGTADQVRKEDLATLQRLQEEFAAELATLRGRVDSLEAVTAELEANQFSTTTKLVGEVIAAVTDNFGSEDENNTVLQDRVRLDFQTSFFGRDILHTRLAAGNAEELEIGAAGADTFEGTQTFNIGNTGGNDVIVDWAAYDFPLFGNSRAYLAAAGGIHSDYAPTVNPYFEDFDGGRGALSAFASESPIYRIGGGAGAALNLSFGEGGFLRPSSITLGYLADNGNDPSEGAGLFNGDYAALGQINFNLGDRFSIAATYVHAYHTTTNGLGNGIFDIGGSAGRDAGGPVVGTALANRPGLLLPGGDVPLVTNSYGVEAAFRLSDRISISGFGAYTDTILLGRGQGETWTFGGGVALPDLGKEGNLLGVFAGVQPTLRSLDAPGVGNFSRDYGLHVEGFYRYQLTDNISITPGVIWLSGPGQNEDNEDAVIGTLRTTFNF
jgi:hypothetical protein